MIMNNDEEIWKPIPGFDGYEVSTLGRIRSLKLNRVKIIKPFDRGKGYQCVNLSINGKCRGIDVHKAVLITFIGPRPEDFEGSHMDCNNQNNKLSNLAWEHKEHNVLRSKAIGRAFGSKNPHSKLTEQLVAKARERYAMGNITLNALAKIYNVDRKTMKAAITRKTWKLVA
jgi:hypothetical protein